MYRSTMRAMVLAICVTAFGVQAAAPTASEMGWTATSAAVEDVQGGQVKALACVGCVAGGAFLILSGWGAILTAAFMPGSALVVAGCVGACATM